MRDELLALLMELKQRDGVDMMRRRSAVKRSEKPPYSDLGWYSFDLPSDWAETVSGYLGLSDGPIDRTGFYEGVNEGEFHFLSIVLQFYRRRTQVDDILFVELEGNAATSNPVLDQSIMDLYGKVRRSMARLAKEMLYYERTDYKERSHWDLLRCSTRCSAGVVEFCKKMAEEQGEDAVSVLVYKSEKTRLTPFLPRWHKGELPKWLYYVP